MLRCVGGWKGITELRTPLILDLLANGADFSATQRHDLTLVRRNTQRLRQLVNQLMDFRKIDVGKIPVRASEGNLVAFVREIMVVFEKTARQRNISLRFLPAEPVLKLWFDQNILDKVFFSLLSNAFKFTPDRGQITVSIQRMPAEGVVRVRVEDTRAGILLLALVFLHCFQGQIQHFPLRV